MKKRLVAISTLVLMAISLVACGKEADNNIYIDMIENKDTAKKVLFLAESQAQEHPTTKGDYEFAKLVKERTNGRIEINVVPSGGLGSDKDILTQTKMGTVDFMRTSVAQLTVYSDIMTILSLPYIYRDGDHMWAVLNGDIGKQALKDIAKADVEGLTFYDSGTRNFYNNKKEITKLSDLQSLRIRAMDNEVAKSTISSLGATAVPMDSSQVLQALALGQVDGAENNTASYVSSSQYTVAKYYTFDEHSSIPDILIASSNTMKNLPKEDQDIIRQAALESTKFQKTEWSKNESEMLSKMKESGVKITQLNGVTKDEFKAAVKPVYDKFTGKYENIIKEIEETK